MDKQNFDTTVNSLFGGMDHVLSSKTVVGEPQVIGDTIILPLVDISFGMGAGAFSGDKKIDDDLNERREQAESSVVDVVDSEKK